MHPHRRYRKKKVQRIEGPPLRGRYPIAFFINAAITAAFILWGLIDRQNIFVMSFFTVVIFGSLYLPFSRNTSRYMFENGSLKVHYLFGGSRAVDLHEHELTYCELGCMHSDHGRIRFIGTHDILQFEHRVTREVVTIHMNSYYKDMRRLLMVIPFQKKPLSTPRTGLWLRWPFSDGIDL
jgi:hypothetical protein